MLREGDPFVTSLVLVECSKSLDYRDSCQLPSPRDHHRVWRRVTIPHFLYQKSSFAIDFNCAVWGQEGNFALPFSNKLMLFSLHQSLIKNQIQSTIRKRWDSFASSLLKLWKKQKKNMVFCIWFLVSADTMKRTEVRGGGGTNTNFRFFEATV